MIDRSTNDHDLRPPSAPFAERLCMSMKAYLCLDIGGSKYIVGLIDRAGNIIESRMGKWTDLTQECVLNTLLDESRSLLAETGIKPRATGITIPGLADPQKGIWKEASFSGIRDFAICEEVERALGLPAYCDNDAQAYSLAEYIFGCCKDVQDFLFINVSNGIGGSIVSDGRLLYGAKGNAGEFGHCVVVPNGRPCKCGSRGCLEMYAAGPALSQNYAEAGGAADESGKPADAKTIAERARGGEALARSIFVEQGRRIGDVAAKAINLLNPSRVVIGGGVSLAFDLFGPSLKDTIQRQIYQSANPGVEVLPTPLGYMAGLYGAASIAVSRTEHILCNV